MNKKITKFIFSALLASFCLSDNTQYQNCVQVTGSTCLLCYKSIPMGKGKGCGPLPSNHGYCDFYSLEQFTGEITCGACDSDHVLNLGIISQTQNACQAKNTIQGCVDAFQFKKDEPPRCVGCLNNLYTNPKTKQNVCASGGNLTVENCLWGGLVVPKFGSSCYRCKPGYALSFDRSKCEVPASPGCMTNESRTGKTCFSCDIYDGYYAVPGGKCVKKQATTE